jgi:hypothetical protein
MKRAHRRQTPVLVLNAYGSGWVIDSSPDPWDEEALDLMHSLQLANGNPRKSSGKTWKEDGISDSLHQSLFLCSSPWPTSRRAGFILKAIWSGDVDGDDQ